MRKNYIDNLRVLCILLLFPFHTGHIYDSLGEQFYVNGVPCVALTCFTSCVYIWWMSGLFVMAGMSTRYALIKRTIGQFAVERIKRLLVPFLAASFLVLPLQSYIADIFWNGYEGGYFAHFKEFFYLTDLGGLDGHYTVGNTWFIVFLFVYSIVFIPLFILYRKYEGRFENINYSWIVLISFAVVFAASQCVLDIEGKSLAQFGFCYLFGYFVTSRDAVMEKLEKGCLPLGIVWVILMACRPILLIADMWETPVNFVVYYMLGWIGILAMLGLGKRYLNREYFWTRYMTQAEFCIFLIHQSILVWLGYEVLKITPSPYLGFVIITIGSFLLTMAAYEILKRFKLTRFLFSIK